MELTKCERLILTNQFEILAALNSDNEHQKETYLKNKRIFEMGFSCEWDQLFDSIEEKKMTDEDCQEVCKILTMYNDIQWSYENLKNKDSVDKDKKYKRLPIDTKYFKATGNSESYGGLKPIGAPFLDLADKMNTSPDKVLVIGDRDDTDGQGARLANMPFVLICNQKKKSKGLSWADFYSKISN